MHDVEEEQLIKMDNVQFKRLSNNVQETPREELDNLIKALCYSSDGTRVRTLETLGCTDEQIGEDGWNSFNQLYNALQEAEWETTRILKVSSRHLYAECLFNAIYYNMIESADKPVSDIARIAYSEYVDCFGPLDNIVMQWIIDRLLKSTEGYNSPYAIKMREILKQLLALFQKGQTNKSQ